MLLLGKSVSVCMAKASLSPRLRCTSLLTCRLRSTSIQSCQDCGPWVSYVSAHCLVDEVHLSKSAFGRDISPKYILGLQLKAQHLH